MWFLSMSPQLPLLQNGKVSVQDTQFPVAILSCNFAMLTHRGWHGAFNFATDCWFPRLAVVAVAVRCGNKTLLFLLLLLLLGLPSFKCKLIYEARHGAGARLRSQTSPACRQKSPPFYARHGRGNVSQSVKFHIWMLAKTLTNEVCIIG